MSGSPVDSVAGYAQSFSIPCTGIPDPDDAWIVAAALDGGADWFVTGDKALLELRRVGNLVVLSPRDAYTQLHGLN